MAEKKMNDIFFSAIFFSSITLRNLSQSKEVMA
jgi:hypothetical protein